MIIGIVEPLLLGSQLQAKRKKRQMFDTFHAIIPYQMFINNCDLLTLIRVKQHSLKNIVRFRRIDGAGGWMYLLGGILPCRVVDLCMDSLLEATHAQYLSARPPSTARLILPA